MDSRVLCRRTFVPPLAATSLHCLWHRSRVTPEAFGTRNWPSEWIKGKLKRPFPYPHPFQSRTCSFWCIPTLLFISGVFFARLARLQNKTTHPFFRVCCTWRMRCYRNLHENQPLSAYTHVLIVIVSIYFPDGQIAMVCGRLQIVQTAGWWRSGTIGRPFAYWFFFRPWPGSILSLKCTH